MKNLEQTIMNLIEWIQPVTVTLVIVALIIFALRCIIGSDESRDKGKKQIPWIVIGAIVLVGAVSIAKEFMGQIAF